MKSLKMLLLTAAVLSLLLTLCACDVEELSENEVLSISLSEKSIDFRAPGESREVVATVVPDTAEDKTLTWSSTNESVASVEDGKIYALGWGVALIRATASNGVSNTVIVTVGKTAPTLTLSSTSVVFNEIGESATLTPSAPGIGVTAEELLWLTSSPAVATVENGVITATGFGVCTITARMNNGITAECTVIVEEPNNAYCYISDSKINLANIDQRHTLTASVSTDAAMKITWISSNPSVATVDGGVVNSTGYGTCAIIAVAENGLSAACVVTVGDSVQTDNPYSDLLRFDVNIPAMSKYVNKITGQVESICTVISAKVTVVDNRTVPYLVDGELGVMVEMRCVKIYDVDGMSGTKSVAATAATFRVEDGEDIFCTNQILREPDCVIGTEFVRTVLVRIMSTPGEQRHFYINFEEHTIL